MGFLYRQSHVDSSVLDHRNQTASFRAQPAMFILPFKTDDKFSA